jgi:hypothetical protein
MGCKRRELEGLTPDRPNSRLLVVTAASHGPDIEAPRVFDEAFE